MRRLYMNEYINDHEEESNIYVGTANEIRLLCKKMWKRCDFLFSHCTFPKFNSSKMYGAKITYRGDYFSVFIMNSDTITWHLSEGNIIL